VADAQVILPPGEADDVVEQGQAEDRRQVPEPEVAEGVGELAGMRIGEEEDEDRRRQPDRDGQLPVDQRPQQRRFDGGFGGLVLFEDLFVRRSDLCRVVGRRDSSSSAAVSES
jgi:hypothetical protein